MRKHRVFLPALKPEDVVNMELATQSSAVRIQQQLRDLPTMDQRLRRLTLQKLIVHMRAQAASLYALGGEISESLQLLDLIPPLALEHFQRRDEHTIGITRPGHPMVTEISYDSTNSRLNLDCVCLSLAVGQLAIATQIAGLAWDPPDASYVSLKSSICRPYDQSLAYALKHMLQGEYEEAKRELDRCRVLPSWTRPIEMQRMLRGILLRDIADFMDGLTTLLEWYAFARPRDGGYEFWLTSDSVLSHWGLGLSVLAIHEGLITLDDLPQNDVRLPRQIVEFALSNERP
jgi:hypothetical protein